MMKRRSSNLRQSLGMPLISGGGFALDQEAVAIKPGDGVLARKSGQDQRKRLTYTTNNGGASSRPKSSFQSSARQTQLGMGRPSQVGIGGRPSHNGMGRPSTAMGRPSTTMGRPSQILHKGTSRPSTGRLSTGRSSMYGSSSQLKKDPRNLSDRSFQLATIKNLLKFLTDKNFPKSMTVKSLQSPTCRDFLHIFNFLLEHIDDSLHVDGMNIVEEVPGVLRLLGYPFNISKNHLLNVGSPHSWPHLLGSMAWLLDGCSIPSNTEEILFCRSGNFDDMDDQKFKHDYEEEDRAYAGYAMHGLESEQYQDIRENRIAMLDTECEETEAANKQLRHENGELSEAIRELSKSSLPVLQAQVEQNDKAIQELEDHLNNEMLPAIKAEEDGKVGMDRKCSETETQLESSREKARELEEQIRVQPMSTAEAQELHQSIRDAENLLRTKRLQQDQSMQRISELQMQHNKSVSEIDEQCQVINHKMHRLSALLPDVASLTPLDYDNSKRADPEILQQLVVHAKRLRDDVQKLHEDVASSTLEYEGKIRAAHSDQGILNTELLKVKLEADNLEQTLDKLGENLDRKRKLNEDAMKSEMVERQILENQLLGLQQEHQQLCEESQAEKKYLAARARSDSEIIFKNEQLRVKTDELKQLLATLTDFVESVRKNEDVVEREVNSLAKDFKQFTIYLPPAKYLEPFNPQL